MVELVQDPKPGLLKKLADIEVSNFGAASGLNEWTLVPLIRHGRVFALWNEGEPIGLCQYMLDWEKPWRAYLVGLSINTTERNKGHATSLLNESFRHIAREKINEVELTVSPDNEAALILYQKKLGFKVVEFRENEYGLGQHRLVMRIKI